MRGAELETKCDPKRNKGSSRSLRGARFRAAGLASLHEGGSADESRLHSVDAGVNRSGDDDYSLRRSQDESNQEQCILPETAHSAGDCACTSTNGFVNNY